METVEYGLLSSRDYRRPKRTVPISVGGMNVATPTWLVGVAAHCRQLTELPVNWDSYGAPPVNSITVQAAIALMERVAPIDLREPRIVPTAGGGLQFEWKIGDKELEVGFVGPAQVSVLYTDDQTGEELEYELVNDLSPLSAVFKKLDPVR